MKQPRAPKGVDLAIQRAYEACDWANLVRLAGRRLQSADEATKALRAAGRSNLRSADSSDRYAAVALLRSYIDDGKTPPEMVLDVLEWASQDMLTPSEWREIVGVLKVQLAKDAVGSKMYPSKPVLDLCIRCFQHCVRKADWGNAQKVAAILDRACRVATQPDTTNPNDAAVRSRANTKTFLFWNIITLHLLSRNPGIQDAESSPWSSLSIRLLKKSMEDATTLGHPRGLCTDEEIGLLYMIASANRSNSDLLYKVLEEDRFNSLLLFRNGNKHLIQLELREKWDSTDKLWKKCHDMLLELDDDKELTYHGSDTATWLRYVELTGLLHLQTSSTLECVFDTLRRHLRDPSIPAIYRRNALLANVDATFHLVPATVSDFRPEPDAISPRLGALCTYVETYATHASCIDDVKTYAEQLDVSGLKYLAYDFTPRLAMDAPTNIEAATIGALCCKLQYLAVTCPRTMPPSCGADADRGFQCVRCHGRSHRRSCANCFRAVAKAAMGLHTTLLEKEGKKGSKTFSQTRAVLADLVLVVALCLIREHRPPTPPGQEAPRRDVLSLSQAAVLLERQYQLTPTNHRVTLVLLRIHLMLGCATRALELWRTLEVKRATTDALGPLFYDRLSYVCPGLVRDATRREGFEAGVLDDMEMHFCSALDEEMPEHLFTAFKDQNYTSVLSIISHQEKIRTGFARITGFVEESRSIRAVGGKKHVARCWDPRRMEIDDFTQIHVTLDLGGFPNWESSLAEPADVITSLGPRPTNARAHLGLLAETFFDLVSQKQPAGYKLIPGDHVFLAESLDRLGNSLGRYINGAEVFTTPAECVYYQIIHLLTLIMSLSLAPPAPKSEEEACFGQFVVAVRTGLEELRDIPESRIFGFGNLGRTVTTLSSLSQISVLRDAATAVRLASQVMSSHSQREADRTKTPLPATVMEHARTLKAEAAAAADRAKEAIAAAAADIKAPDFEKRFKAWVLSSENDEEMGAVVEAMARDLVNSTRVIVKSWKEQLRGWEQVKWG